MSVELRNDQQVDLGFTDDALVSIAKKGIKRNTSARGLRSILEGVLLDTMFGMDESMIDNDLVEGCNEPIRVYAENKKAGDAS